MIVTTQTSPALGFVCLAGLVGGCLGTRAAPAQEQDMPGVWIGQFQHHWGTMYRLELTGDGKGFLIVSAPNTEPPHAHLYEITRWVLEDGKFNAIVRQIAPSHHQVPLKIHGSAVAPAYLYLQLDEQEPSGRWRRSKLRMVTASEFLEDLERQRTWVQDLDARMQAYRLDRSWDGE